MVNNLTNDFAVFRQLQRPSRGGPSRQPRTKSKSRTSDSKCKICGANESKFFENNTTGNMICTDCGVVQSERKLVHHNNRVENGQVLYARVIVEDDAKIKLLVNNFFNVIFGDLRSENRAGSAIALIYKDMKKYRARYVMKTDIQSAFKGLHMPTIVCCILYCTLLQENRAMPLSIIVNIMNVTLLKSRTETKPVNLQTAYLYRTHKKYGFSSFFKLHRMKCYNNELFPSNFIHFTCNTLLRIQDKNIHRMLNVIGDEIYKEYPDTTSPALIATGVLYFIGNKLGTFDYKMFGLKKKELNDMKQKIESSNNEKITRLLAVL